MSRVSDVLLEALLNVLLGVLFLLLGLKARTYHSDGRSANTPRRRRILEAERSRGFWWKCFGG